MNKEEKEAYLKQRLDEMQVFENELKKNGLKYIAGVDEVGRGPLAGPVVAACVVLPDGFDVLGVDDSKKLSEKKRNELFEIIKEKALAIGIGMRDNKRIDEINILEATKEAMIDAVKECDKLLAASSCGSESETVAAVIEHVLFDAIKIEAVKKPQTSIIKGDSKSVSIAAASIIAKVTRDRMMCEFAKEYPHYSFEKNKGYGTKVHYDGISTAGICPIHRRSFLKNVAK